jgi:hypothetical protein
VKGIAMRRGASARVTCTDNLNITAGSIDQDKNSTSYRDTKISVTTSESLGRHRSLSSPSLQQLDIIRPVCSHSSRLGNETELQDLSPTPTPGLSHHGSLTPALPVPTYKSAGRSVLRFLLSLISPPTIACFLSLVIALVPQLKALFVANVPGVNMPDAPDGTPPLAWILDITSFGGFSPFLFTLIIGGASVPTGLVILGASLSTLSIRNGLPPW